MADTTNKGHISPIKKIFGVFSRKKQEKQELQGGANYHHVPSHAAASHEKTTAQMPLSERTKAEPERFHYVSEGQSQTPAESAGGKDVKA